jgi:hypothetical protein
MRPHTLHPRMIDTLALWTLLVLLCFAFYACGRGSTTNAPSKVPTNTPARIASSIPARTVTSASVSPATFAPTETAGTPDRAMLFNPTCKLPCWEGLIPGQTNKKAFVDLIQLRFHSPPNTLEQHPIGNGTVIGAGYASDPDKSFLAYVKDDIIQVINVDATSEITMSEVIKTFGTPTKIQMDAGAYGNELAGYDVRIFYPQHGLVIHFARTGFLPKFRAAVQPDLMVDEITLFPVGSTENILSVAKQFKGPTRIAPIYQLPLQDWHGFGDYEIPPPLPP